MDAHALEMKMVGKEPKNFKDGGKKKKKKKLCMLIRAKCENNYRAVRY